jgi:hypothetical protein
LLPESSQLKDGGAVCLRYILQDRSANVRSTHAIFPRASSTAAYGDISLIVCPAVEGEGRLIAF